MEKLARKAAKSVFLKIAEDKERSYPLSRTYTGLTDTATLGMMHALQGRAAQGRANLGQEGLTTAEDLKLKAIGKKDSEKSYPISRFITNPTVSGSVLGAAGAIAGARKGTVRGLVGLGLGSASGYLGSAMARDLYARSDFGKANAGRKGFGKTKQHQLKKLRETNPDSSEAVQSKMDSDTNKSVALGLSGIAANQINARLLGR